MANPSEPLTLSASDTAVLKALQNDAAPPARDLAERLGMSQSTLSRKINDLEKSGAIRKRVALLDADRLGFPVCVFVFINMANHDPTTRSAFETFVGRTPEIMKCFSVTGAHDYTLIIRARSVSEFERLLMDRILAHPSVASATSQIALRQHKDSTELPL